MYAESTLSGGSGVHGRSHYRAGELDIQPVHASVGQDLPHNERGRNAAGLPFRNSSSPGTYSRPSRVREDPRPTATLSCSF